MERLHLWRVGRGGRGERGCVGKKVEETKVETDSSANLKEIVIVVIKEF